jgi:hypothetical protein
VFDESIVLKLKADTIFEDGDLITTEKMVDWCIAELQYKAKIFEKICAVSVYDGDVLKSDTAIPDSLKEALKAAVSPLEQVPARDRTGVLAKCLAWLIRRSSHGSTGAVEFYQAASLALRIVSSGAEKESLFGYPQTTKLSCLMSGTTCAPSRLPLADSFSGYHSMLIFPVGRAVSSR